VSDVGTIPHPSAPPSAAPGTTGPPARQGRTAYPALLSPLRLRHLTLKNRVMSSAHAPAYTAGGVPNERYQAYHEEKAKGGLALTMFGGSSNVARDAGSIYGQIYVGSDAIVPHFRAFARRIHRHGAALMCQVSHMGRRTSWDAGDWFPTIAPSVVRDPAHHSVPRAMSTRDIARIVRAFGEAARRCRDGELDGCELLATTHLLGQFLSPLSNRRDDAYGGALANRARFLLEVVEEVRTRAGDDFVIGVRYAADEANEGGLSQEEGMEIARLVAATGAVDFLNVNGRYAGTAAGMAETYPGMAFPSAPYLALAKRVREVSGLPVFQAARINDLATADFAVAEGYLDMVGMTRPHMADPHIVAKLERGEEARIRPCVGAGYCIDRGYNGRDALCLFNAATGRETSMPHAIAPAGERRRVVVVGGGPGGLEAARVCGERGHAVVLFEAAERVGGQLILAGRATWRRDMAAILHWYESELARLGVEVRLAAYADRDAVLAARPDVVIVATGGVPMQDMPEGGEDLATTSWDLLAGQSSAEGRVLVYDETGSHSGLSTAEFAAASGGEVELVTPDRQAGLTVGGLNYPIHLRELYGRGVKLTPDLRLLGARRSGNGLVVRFLNSYSRAIEEREVDRLVTNYGTLPADELFQDLVDLARNAGEVDIDALAEGRLELPEVNPEGAFQLFRIGDAVASRNVHAAVYDALRICKTL
jgi:2,4-dienoyl-CoA reductase-like NADH-dependent reductase (Old Yellow Enzyme family)